MLPEIRGHISSLEVKIKSECITSCIGGDPFYVAKSVITEM
jgi:hypothetical protein